MARQSKGYADRVAFTADCWDFVNYRELFTGALH